MRTSSLRIEHGVPVIHLDGERTPPIAAYVGPRYAGAFQQAGISLYTFYVYGNWWVGPRQYNFEEIDESLSKYFSAVPRGYFMPRIDLSRQGFPWWGEANPTEMDVIRDIRTGTARNPLEPNPAAIPYLGHAVDLSRVNLHSFHSTIWRKEAGEALAALIRYCEGRPYADRIWAWHICDGLFCE